MAQNFQSTNSYDEMPLGVNGAKGLSFEEQVRLAVEKDIEKSGNAKKESNEQNIKENLFENSKANSKENIKNNTNANFSANKKEYLNEKVEMKINVDDNSKIKEEDKPLNVHNDGRNMDFSPFREEVKEIDVSGMTLEERIKHKNFKVKKDAVEEIIGKIQDMTTFDEGLFNLFPLLLSVTNLLEQIEEKLLIFFGKNFYIPKTSQDSLNELIKALVEQGFCNIKKPVREKSILVIICAVESLMSTDTLCENLVTMMKSKNAKVNMGGVGISRILFDKFGAGVFNYKKISEAVAKLSEHCSPLIKKEIVEFYIEEFKWLRKNVKLLIEGKLKDAIKQDIYKVIDPLEEQYAKNGPNYKPKNPEHLIGNKKAVNNQIETSRKSERKINENNLASNDNLDLSDIEGVDVFIKKNGFDDKFIKLMSDNKTKWKIKVEELSRFVQITDKLVKIKNNNRKEFMDVVKLMLKDANIIVKQETIKVIRNLSRCLGKDFKEAKELFLPMLDIFKIKKEPLTNALMEAFEHMIKYMDDNCICDIIIKYSNNQICTWSKLNLCKLIEDKIMLTKKNIAPLLKSVVLKMMDDPTIEVRNQAVKVMSLFATKREDIFESEKNSIDKTKYKKIEDYIRENNLQKSEGNTENKFGKPKSKVNHSKAFSLDEDIEMEECLDNIEEIGREKKKKNNDKNKKTNNFNKAKKSKSKSSSNSGSRHSSRHSSGSSKSSSSRYSSRKDSKAKNLSKGRNNSRNNASNYNSNSSFNNTSARGRNQSAPGSMNRNQSGNGLINKTIQASHKESNISRFNLKNIKKQENVQQVFDIRVDLNDKEIITIENNIPNITINNIKSDKWNDRKTGFESLNKFLGEDMSFDELNDNIELYLRYILNSSKEFKDSNLPTFRAALSCISTLCERIPKFIATYSCYLINLLLPKVADRKLAEPVFDFFNQLISLSREEPRWMIILLIRKGKTKSAYVHRELGNFLAKVIGDAYKIEMFPIKELIEFAIFLEDATNSQCRNAGTAILVQLYYYFSEDLFLFLKKLKESTQKRIVNELKKIYAKVESIDNREKRDKGIEIINKMFPPSDISKKINADMMRKLKSGKWDEKTTILREISKILEMTGFRILPNGLKELFNTLKLNLNDPNKNVVKEVIELISVLARSLNSDFKLYYKNLIQVLFSKLVEKGNDINNEAFNCVQQIINAVGLNSVIPTLSGALSHNNYEIKNSSLQLLTQNKDKLNNDENLMGSMADGLVKCLLDKNQEIRSKAEEISFIMMQKFGESYLSKKLMGLTPAYQQTIKQLINKFNQNKLNDDINTVYNDNDTNNNYNSYNNTYENTKNSTTNTNNLYSNNEVFDVEMKDGDILESAAQFCDKLEKDRKNNMIINDKNNEKYMMTNITLIKAVKNTQIIQPTEESYESPLIAHINKSLLTQIEQINLSNDNQTKIYYLYDLFTKGEDKNSFKYYTPNTLKAYVNFIGEELGKNLNNLKVCNDEKEINETRVSFLMTLTIYTKLVSNKYFLGKIDKDLLYYSLEKLFNFVAEKGLEELLMNNDIYKVLYCIIGRFISNENKQNTLQVLFKLLEDYYIKNGNNIFEYICNTLNIFTEKYINNTYSTSYDVKNIMMQMHNFYIKAKSSKNNSNEKRSDHAINLILYKLVQIHNSKLYDYYNDFCVNIPFNCDYDIKRCIDYVSHYDEKKAKKEEKIQKFKDDLSKNMNNKNIINISPMDNISNNNEIINNRNINVTTIDVSNNLNNKFNDIHSEKNSKDNLLTTLEKTIKNASKKTNPNKENYENLNRPLLKTNDKNNYSNKNTFDINYYKEKLKSLSGFPTLKSHKAFGSFGHNDENNNNFNFNNDYSMSSNLNILKDLQERKNLIDNIPNKPSNSIIQDLNKFNSNFKNKKTEMATFVKFKQTSKKEKHIENKDK